MSIRNREGAFYWLAERFRRVGRVDRAEDLLNAGLEQSPKHLGARVARARIRLAHGDRRGARDDTEFVLGWDAHHWAALVLLARLMAAEGWVHGERAVVKRLQQLDPGHPKLLQWAQRLDLAAARLPTAPELAVPVRAPEERAPLGGALAGRAAPALGLFPSAEAEVATLPLPSIELASEEPALDEGPDAGTTDAEARPLASRTPPSSFRAVTQPGVAMPADISQHFRLARRGTTQPAAAVPTVPSADLPSGSASPGQLEGIFAVDAAVARGELGEAREILLRMLGVDPARDSLRRRFLECGGTERELPLVRAEPVAAALAEPEALESLLRAVREHGDEPPVEGS